MEKSFALRETRSVAPGRMQPTNEHQVAEAGIEHPIKTLISQLRGALVEHSVSISDLQASLIELSKLASEHGHSTIADALEAIGAR